MKLGISHPFPAQVERCGGRVDPRADADVTPIQLAAWQLRLEVLEYLESAGADPARVNGFGCTAAHWVVLAPKDRAAVPGEPVLPPLPLAHRAAGRRPAAPAVLEVVRPLTWVGSRLGLGIGSGFRFGSGLRSCWCSALGARVGASAPS